MTEEEFDSIRPGDIVRNVKNGSIKSVLPAGYPIEPSLATTKDRIEGHLDMWEIHMRAVHKEPKA